MTYCCDNIRRAKDLIVKAGGTINWSNSWSDGEAFFAGLTLGISSNFKQGSDLKEANRRMSNAYGYLCDAESEISMYSCGIVKDFYKDRESELVDKFNNLNTSSSSNYSEVVNKYNVLREKFNALVDKYNGSLENNKNDYNKLVNEYNDLLGRSKSNISDYNTLRDKHNNLVNEYNNLSKDSVKDYNILKDKYNKLVDEYNDKNADYHEYKEKYDDTKEELHSEKLDKAKKMGDEKLKHLGEKSQLQNQNTKLQEKLEAANSEKIDLRKRLKDKEEENSRLLIKLDDKNNQLTVLRLESGKKDNELERKSEEIRNLKNQAKSSDKRAEKTQEDLLNEKLRSEKGNLELFATELKISSEQVNNLIRYHERLFQARKDYNQANIETHEDNIARIKEELKEKKISIVNIQEICRKCERIAELSSELGFEPKTQPQQQTNYSYSFTSRNRNWKNIHPDFTPELVQEWKNHGFTYEECADWINVSPLNQQNRAIKEPAYYAWLRDVKQVDSYWVLNEGDSQQLGLEFLQWYQQQFQAQQEQPTK